MQGNNTIQMCQASMIEAMQEWCDKHLVDKVKVESVVQSRTNTSSMGHGNVFEIKVSTPVKEPPKV